MKEYNQALKQLQKDIQWRENNPEYKDDLTQIAYEKVCLGYILLFQKYLLNHNIQDSTIQKTFNEAVNKFQQSGHYDYLPLSLLGRATLYTFTGEYSLAEIDLEEVQKMSKRHSMVLYEVDYELCYARLNFFKNQVDLSKKSLAKAKMLINQTGYHRKDHEIQSMEILINMRSTWN